MVLPYQELPHEPLQVGLVAAARVHPPALQPMPSLHPSQGTCVCTCMCHHHHTCMCHHHHTCMCHLYTPPASAPASRPDAVSSASFSFPDTPRGVSSSLLAAWSAATRGREGEGEGGGAGVLAANGHGREGEGEGGGEQPLRPSESKGGRAEAWEGGDGRSRARAGSGPQVGCH